MTGIFFFDNNGFTVLRPFSDRISLVIHPTIRGLDSVACKERGVTRLQRSSWHGMALRTVRERELYHVLSRAARPKRERFRRNPNHTASGVGP